MKALVSTVHGNRSKACRQPQVCTGSRWAGVVQSRGVVFAVSADRRLLALDPQDQGRPLSRHRLSHDLVGEVRRRAVRGMKCDSRAFGNW